jgi:hypothetical protein
MMCPMCGNEADDHTHELTSRFIAYMTEEITRLTTEHNLRYLDVMEDHDEW